MAACVLAIAVGGFVALTSAQQTATIRAGLDGTAPASWHPRGPATWRLDKSEIVATVPASGEGGWLVSDRRYQDLSVKFSFRCTGPCQTGVLLGMTKNGDRDEGLFVSLADGDLAASEMTVDAQGKEIERHRPAGAPEPGAGRGGGRGGNAAAGGGAGAAGGRQGGGGGGRGAGALPSLANHPLSIPRPPAGIRKDDWNTVEVRLYSPVAATATALQVVLNGTNVTTGYPASSAGSTAFGPGDRIAQRPADLGRFGWFAFRIAGNAGAEVRFKDVSILNYTELLPVTEKISNRFRMQTVTPYFYGDGSCVGDLDRDGNLDIVGGLVYWLGPDFKKGRPLDAILPLAPTDYGATLSCGVFDWTGDGWPDVMYSSFPGGGPIYLYVNPHNELRRWERHKVVENTQGGTTESIVFMDMDGDGKPEVVYGGDGYAGNYAKPDPADATKPWVVRNLTERSNWGPHGTGAGEVNGDGRPDMLRGWGWWEQPADASQTPWKFHPEAFGRTGLGAGGGAQLETYDVNGDGLNDVITSLEAHGYGLAWFEQKKDAAGNISFVEHMIMDHDPAKSRGVVFTEMHGLTVADVDGDGLKDIVTGKHRDHQFGGFHYSFSWIDEDNDNVFYWFKLTRKAGGVVEYVPYLIHNTSGVGRQPIVVDLNKDGVPDVINSGRFGTLVFFGKKGAVD